MAIALMTICLANESRAVGMQDFRSTKAPTERISHYHCLFLVSRKSQEKKELSPASPLLPILHLGLLEEGS